MTSAKFWNFLTPSPPCPHLELIHLLRPLFHDADDAPPPLMRTSYLDASKREEKEEVVGKLPTDGRTTPPRP